MLGSSCDKGTKNKFLIDWLSFDFCRRRVRPNLRMATAIDFPNAESSRCRARTDSFTTPRATWQGLEIPQMLDRAPNAVSVLWMSVGNEIVSTSRSQR